MKLKYPKQIFLALFIAIGFAGCDEEEIEVPLTLENLVGQYKVTALTKSTAITAETSIFTEVFPETCQQDDIIELKTDYSVKYIDAGVSCNPANNYTFSWELTGKFISFLGEHPEQLNGGKVEKFDGQTLVLSYSESGIKIKATLVKQPQ